MGIRRQARELAMQALFSMDMSCAFSQEALVDYCRCFPPDKRLNAFFEHLVKGVLAHRDRIDKLIEAYSSNWKMRRMACVDRNILRIAVFELIYCADIPAKVSINEAIDIGKRFGSPESGSFINGILDSIRIAITMGQVQTICTPPPVNDETHRVVNDA
ncbi:MAG: transcription antitermination factor NusB [Desulfatitalea sp.]|nr:transcription antitermination factor NusB [Desulfatitalea sp.]NNJ99087.1 transcription antitermination factor NusB [Desulfatitalea sp.]